jgi:uncharacterized damage-inducible protein DinB
MNRRSSTRTAAIALVAIAALSLTPVAALAGSSVKTAFLADLDGLEEKIVGLADAIPADQYDWAPGEGVRTVSQAFMHMASAMHYFSSQLGATPPANMGELESITDKAAVAAELEKAFAAARTTVGALTDADLEGTLQLFGREWTKGQVVYLVGTHNHEHLGQAIAYARSLGVTPPWSQPAS